MPKRVQGGKIKLRIAPLQHPHRVKRVAFQPPHQIVLERVNPPGHAKSAVAGIPPGAAGDLAHLGGCELSVLITVKLAISRKRDMVDIKIEAHADRVGGDKEIHVAILK